MLDGEETMSNVEEEKLKAREELFSLDSWMQISNKTSFFHFDFVQLSFISCWRRKKISLYDWIFSFTFVSYACLNVKLKAKLEMKLLIFYNKKQMYAKINCKAEGKV